MRNFPILERFTVMEVVGRSGSRSTLLCALHTAGQLAGTPGATNTAGLRGGLPGEGATAGTPTPIRAPNGSRGRIRILQVTVAGIVSLSSALKPRSFNRDGTLGRRFELQLLEFSACRQHPPEKAPAPQGSWTCSCQEEPAQVLLEEGASS